MTDLEKLDECLQMLEEIRKSLEQKENDYEELDFN